MGKRSSRGFVHKAERRGDEPRRPDAEVAAEAAVVAAGRCPLCRMGELRPIGPRPRARDLQTDRGAGRWLRCDRPECGHMVLPGIRMCQICSRPMAALALGEICVRCRARQHNHVLPESLPRRRRCSSCFRYRMDIDDSGVCPECQANNQAAAAAEKGVDHGSETTNEG